jgi:hypothetical protein
MKQSVLHPLALLMIRGYKPSVSTVIHHQNETRMPQRHVNNGYLLSWNPHLRINCSRTDPGLPGSHDTIYVRPRWQKAIVLTPHIPFL